MCLIFISLHNHANYKLVIAGNRDEFYRRQTAVAGYWDDSPSILAGRDLEGGGTWMGITRTGRVSMLTNYRDPKNINPTAPSRGHLVADYLRTDREPEGYLQGVIQNGKSYNGFNLIVGSSDELWYYSNYGNGIAKIPGGFFGISNHLLETPWPKVTRGKQKMEAALKQSKIDPEEIFQVLYDDHIAEDRQLPDTGLPIEKERALSSMFIKTDNYGSRCSTVILMDNENRITFAERVYDTSSFDYTTRKFSFKV